MRAPRQPPTSQRARSRHGRHDLPRRMPCSDQGGDGGKYPHLNLRAKQGEIQKGGGEGEQRSNFFREKIRGTLLAIAYHELRVEQRYYPSSTQVVPEVHETTTKV